MGVGRVEGIFVAAQSGIEEIVFCCFSPGDLAVYEDLL